MTPPNGNGKGTAVTADSFGELARGLSEQSSRLAQLEVELAKAELRDKGRRVALGAVALSAAAIIGLGAVGAGIATAIIALDLWLPTWVAALIVTGALTLIATLTALAGGDRFRAAAPAAPERAIQTTREDIEIARESIRKGRS